MASLIWSRGAQIEYGLKSTIVHTKEGAFVFRIQKGLLPFKFPAEGRIDFIFVTMDKPRRLCSITRCAQLFSEYGRTGMQRYFIYLLVLDLKLRESILNIIWGQK